MQWESPERACSSSSYLRFALRGGNGAALGYGRLLPQMRPKSPLEALRSLRLEVTLGWSHLFVEAALLPPSRSSTEVSRGFERLLLRIGAALT